MGTTARGISAETLRASWEGAICFAKPAPPHAMIGLRGVAPVQTRDMDIDRRVSKHPVFAYYGRPCSDVR